MVEVYLNTNKDTFSVRTNGKVTHSGECIELVDVKFHVNEKGRLRVCENRRKNVHATLKPLFYAVWEVPLCVDDLEIIYYNPYCTQKFMSVKTGRVIEWADRVILMDKKIFAQGVRYV